jgi:tetratricopeptide (TPR) repeat protein
MNFGIQLSTRKLIFFSLLLITIVSIVSYVNTLNVPFHADDIENIVYRTYVMNIDAFFDPVKTEKFNLGHDFRIRKVGYFTFAVNYRLHGADVAGYHIVNIAIHIINGLLVYFLLLFTFRTPYFNNSSAPPLSLRGGRVGLSSSQPSSVSTLNSQLSTQFVSLAAALLFVSHPIQTQAVTYIVQRLASLATLFYLLSLVMYIKGRLASQRQAKAKVEAKVEKDTAPNFRPQSSVSAPVLTFFVLSFLSAVLAMKTKEIAFTLPLVIALYEFMFFEGGLKKRMLFLVPLLLTMLIIPMELIALGRPTGEIIGDVSEATRVGTAITRWEYLFTEFRVIVTYIRLLFFPVNQNLDYDYPVYHTFFDPNVFLSFLFLMSIFGIGVYLLYKSRQKARGEGQEEKNKGREGVSPNAIRLLPIASYRLIAFGIFWFFITLSVESSIIPIADVIFEHRLYLPSIGGFIAVTAALSIVWERIKGKRQWAGMAAAGGLGVIIIILSGATYARNNLWLDEVSFWQDVIKKSPSKTRGRVNLGYSYSKQGRFEEAIREFQTAIRLDPDDYQLYNNLGVAYKGQGRFNEAILEFQNAMRLKPDDGMTYYNLGNVFREMGDYKNAIQHYLVAVKYEPDIPVIHNNLAIAYIGQGNKKEAEREFRTAIDIDPQYEAARRNLEMLLRGGG